MKIDITKLSDSELQELSSVYGRNVQLSGQNECLRDNLWALVRAVGRLLDDKYSEGDEKVRNQLWKDMHTTADKARSYLEDLKKNITP